MASKNQDSVEVTQAEMDNVTYEALPSLVGVRAKVAKAHYWNIEQLSSKTGVDKGVILEAALMAFEGLERSEKIRLLSEVGANRIAANY